MRILCKGIRWQQWNFSFQTFVSCRVKISYKVSNFYEVLKHNYQFIYLLPPEHIRMSTNISSDIYSLTLAACQLIYLRERTECSITNRSFCLSCPVFGSYLTGDNPNNYTGVGHIICIIIWLLTSMFGTFGTIANIVIILTLQQKTKKRAFDTLLKGLAAFDAIFCLSSVSATTSAIFYLRKYFAAAVVTFNALDCNKCFQNSQKTGVDRIHQCNRFGLV